jgi:hypothetical protein
MACCSHKRADLQTSWGRPPGSIIIINTSTEYRHKPAALVALAGHGTWSSLHIPQKPIFPAFHYSQGPMVCFSIVQIVQSMVSIHHLAPKVWKVVGMFVVFRRLGQN